MRYILSANLPDSEGKFCLGSRTGEILPWLQDLESVPTNQVDRAVWTFGWKLTIELTHNSGTESDPEFK
ncbi:hypothetical protein MLD38_017268 [Melastoma candidum]|uniref:Uncharacterized protein n=1 Tax=Melastoma candidum TaxID=119954 RepID=A0ACB9QTM2_9MYRT|nr:hypothetical protein MLD38_017268 [Melastoma candidum]